MATKQKPINGIQINDNIYPINPVDITEIRSKGAIINVSSMSSCNIAFGVASDAQSAEAPQVGDSYGTKNIWAATALGIGTTVSATGGVAIGLKTEVSGNGYGFSAGYMSVASGRCAIALGSQVTAAHENAIVLGTGLASSDDDQITLGRYNGQNSQALLVIGDGIASSVLHNAIEVYPYDQDRLRGSIAINADVAIGGSLVAGNGLFVNASNKKLQTVLGQFNTANDEALFIIGDGSKKTDNTIQRHNLLVAKAGSIDINGNLKVDGTISATAIDNLSFSDDKTLSINTITATNLSINGDLDVSSGTITAKSISTDKYNSNLIIGQKAGNQISSLTDENGTLIVENPGSILVVGGAGQEGAINTIQNSCSLTVGMDNTNQGYGSAIVGAHNVLRYSIENVATLSEQGHGAYSFISGNSNDVTSNYSFTSGLSHSVNSTYSFTSGNDNETNYAPYSFIAGHGNVIGPHYTNDTAYEVSTYFTTAIGSGNTNKYENDGANCLTLIGYHLIPASNAFASIVMGKYNKTKKNSIFTIGNGNETTSNNAFSVDSTGNAYAKTHNSTTGADYAEFFEWIDGNPLSEDRIGIIVTLRNKMITPCGSNNVPLGIVSGTAAFTGDGAALDWKEKYLTDKFGRILYEEVETFMEIPDEEGNMIQISNGIEKQPIINPNYDSDKTYIPREERPEWAIVGLFGKIYTRDDGTCTPGCYGKPADGGILTHSDEPTQFYIMERTAEDVVLVFLK